MKNKEKYIQTKYIVEGNIIKPTSNMNYLLGSSWLIVKLVANLYQKFIPLYAKGLLLDLGCGIVPLYDAYNKYVDDNICVDWENSLHKNDYLDYTCDLNGRLPFEDAMFDTIILSDVIEHIKEPNQLISECVRVLKKDGCLFINAPFFYWVHEAPYDYGRYTNYFYEDIANKLSISICEIEKVGGALDVISDITGKLLCLFSPRVGGKIARLGQKIHYYVCNKMPLSKRINAAKCFALGYFVIYRKT